MKKRDWMFPYVKENKHVFVLAIVIGVLGFGSAAMLLFVSGYLISKSALQPENIMMVYVPIVGVRAFSIGQAAFKYLHRLVGHDFVLRILEKMRSKLYRVLEPQALSLRSRHRTGDLLGVLSDDIEHLQHLFLRTIFPGAIAVTLYGALIAVVGYFDWMFALQLGLILGVIIFAVPLISLYRAKRQHRKKKHVRGQLYLQLTDAVSGLSDWQASGRTNELFTSYRQKESELLNIEQKMLRREHMRDAFLQIFMGVAVIAMLFWTNTQVESGVFASTVIAAFVLMTISLSDALMPVSEAAEHLPTFEDSLQRIYAIEDEGEKVKEQSVWDEDADSTASTHEGKTSADSAPISAAKDNGKYALYAHLSDKNKAENSSIEEETLQEPVLEMEQKNIDIQQLSYRYGEEEDWIIRNLSLQIKAGTKVALLGRSGAGKSTLLKLLSGTLQPTEGEIKVGEGRATSGLLAKSLSVLNQKPHLFDTTVGNNIRIGRQDASDKEIWEVAEKAQIADLIKELPLGLGTPMHEMGKRFSGGERQRIAFARVLLQNTPIIILDEPTIGLDPITENALLDTMFTAAQDKTIIWVTHHLAGIHHADEIVFLEDGQIAMQGSHQELLQTNEKYRVLYEMERGM